MTQRNLACPQCHHDAGGETKLWYTQYRLPGHPNKIGATWMGFECVACGCKFDHTFKVVIRGAK